MGLLSRHLFDGNCRSIYIHRLFFQYFLLNNLQNRLSILRFLHHNKAMSNSQEVTRLNQLINDIQILLGSLKILDQSIVAKNSAAQSTALDAINFRVREIAKYSDVINAQFIANSTSSSNSTGSSNSTSSNRFGLDITKIILELSSAIPNISTLHNLLDSQLESLRKWALSEILALSIQ